VVVDPKRWSNSAGEQELSIRQSLGAVIPTRVRHRLDVSDQPPEAGSKSSDLISGAKYQMPAATGDQHRSVGATRLLHGHRADGQVAAADQEFAAGS
jgi:hypothetical protein